jgi:TetR/AcrR family transcriptional repressor of nem operon
VERNIKNVAAHKIGEVRLPVEKLNFKSLPVHEALNASQKKVCILRYRSVSLRMRNSEQTKETILKKSGELFNTQGYKATPISLITEATGFTKGAIYRHFENKEALEKESLRYLASILFQKLIAVIKAEKTAGNKLRALFKYYESLVCNIPLTGGCPLMNAAIEADDANPLLKKEALTILNMLRESVIKVLDNGIRYQQIKPEIDKEFYATLIIATLEGGIMMSKLTTNTKDIKKLILHLEEQVRLIETK